MFYIVEVMIHQVITPLGEGTSIGVDEAKPSLLGDEHDFIIARNAGGIGNSNVACFC